MPDKNELIVEEKGAVCSIVFNRPEKRNLLTPGMLLGLEKALVKLGKEGRTRCVVIRGAGDKAFSSGYDISSIGRDDMIKNHSGENPLPRAVKSIKSFPYPVIAMLNGHAFGAGLEIAATCDIRTAAKGSLLGMPPAKLGLVEHIVTREVGRPDVVQPAPVTGDGPQANLRGPVVVVEPVQA